MKTRVGSQKWKGATPSFTISAKKNSLILRLGEYEKNDAKIITEAILWTKKYFIAEKVDWALLKIKGRKENVLISNPNHMVIKFEEDTINIGLNKSVE